MKTKKQIFFYIISAFFTLTLCTSQPRRPRHLPPPSPIFKLLGIEIGESEEELFSVRLLFSDIIDPRTFTPVNIEINARPLPPVVQFYFAKNRRGVMFKLPRRALKSDDTFDMVLTGIKSLDGREMERTELIGIEVKEKIWQRLL